MTNFNKAELEQILEGKIIETPGHTDDSISLMIEDGVIFSGDATMNGFPSIRRITIWIENVEEYEESWKKISFSGAKKIYPAHGKPFKPSELKKNINWIKKVRLYRL